MPQLDYQKLDATPVAETPFRHVVVTNFVPCTVLPDVLAGLPSLKRGGSFPTGGLRLGAKARATLDELAGPRFRQSVAAKFGLALDDAPVMMTLRGQSRAKDGRIHTDSTAKRVTVLLYLNPDAESWTRHDGCLRLLNGAGDLDDYAIEVPPVNGTLLVFPNGPNTWHGHKPFVGPRHVLQLNYMATDAKARSEIRRHKVSALIKRLTSAD